MRRIKACTCSIISAIILVFVWLIETFQFPLDDIQQDLYMKIRPMVLGNMDADSYLANKGYISERTRGHPPFRLVRTIIKAIINSSDGTLFIISL